MNEHCKMLTHKKKKKILLRLHDGKLAVFLCAFKSKTYIQNNNKIIIIIITYSLSLSLLHSFYMVVIIQFLLLIPSLYMH